MWFSFFWLESQKRLLLYGGVIVLFFGAQGVACRPGRFFFSNAARLLLKIHDGARIKQQTISRVNKNETSFSLD